MGEVVYNGRYVPLRGVETSRAYAPTLHILRCAGRSRHPSDPPLGGTAVRRNGLHMCRIFFTGAFRKPREVDWLIGMTCCCCSASSRGSSATHCPTTCCPAPGCGSPDDIQRALGDGPSQLVISEGRTVRICDLLTDPRWPDFGL
jgi:Cytochrome b(N-terminal)/b6/petB